MSYEIRYHPNLRKKFATSKSRRGAIWGIRCLIVAVVLALLIGFRTSDLWGNFMIPGEPTKTLSAVETFGENLKEGASFESAFRNFCIEIVSTD